MAAFAALLVFSQTAGAQSKTVEIKPDPRIRQTIRGKVFNTYSVFPPISTSIGQRGFKPSNPGTLAAEPPLVPDENYESIFSGAAGPSVGPQFPGIGSTGWTPPDPDMAVGPNHIVQVVNSSVAFYSKAGALQFQQTAQTFLAPVRQTTFNFDPKVIYDRLAQRFVIVFLDLNTGASISNVLLAVSDNSDPNGSWFMYRINVAQVIDGSPSWLDYPGLGYNKDGYVVCGNMFGFSPQVFRASKYVVIPKAPVLTGAPIPTPVSFTNNVASPQTAETVDPLKDTVFAVARLRIPMTNTTTTRFFAFRNVGSPAPTMSSIDISVASGAWVTSDAASTSGRFLDTIDGRIHTAIWRNGRMVLAYSISQGGGLTGTRWGEYNTGTWPVGGTVSEVQAGNYTSGSINQFMPAINVNKHGDISILFTQSSNVLTANMAVAGRVTSDTTNSMSAASVLVASSGNNYPDGRWGDYFGVDVDPVDDETFWGTAMVVGAGNAWQTHIMSWNVSKTWPVAPNAFSWFRGNPQSGNVASLAADDGNYLVALMGDVPMITEPPAQLVVEGTAPAGQVLGIDVRAVAKVNTTGVSQKIELFDWVSNSYVQVGATQVSTMTDSLHIGNATGTLANFVQAGTRKVRAKVSFFATSPTFMLVWIVSVDQAQWNIRVR